MQRKWLPPRPFLAGACRRVPSKFRLFASVHCNARKAMQRRKHLFVFRHQKASTRCSIRKRRRWKTHPSTKRADACTWHFNRVPPSPLNEGKARQDGGQRPKQHRHLSSAHSSSFRSLPPGYRPPLPESDGSPRGSSARLPVKRQRNPGGTQGLRLSVPGRLGPLGERPHPAHGRWVHFGRWKPWGNARQKVVGSALERRNRPERDGRCMLMFAACDRLAPYKRLRQRATMACS